MNMDITDSLAPNGDQLDAIELIAGPRIFTVEKVSKGNAEQPVNVHLAEFPRPWRPGKSMRRVLAACWGVDASEWVGRRVELFCDTEVVFGGKAVGGTRVKRLSHIDKAQKIPLLVTRGKSAIYVVDPLPDAPVSTLTTNINGAKAEALRAEWKSATPERRAEIEAEVAALGGAS